MSKRDASHLAAAATAKKSKQNGSITAFFGAPKVKVAAKFDKSKWVEGLTPDQKELLQLEIDTLDESWLGHLKDEIVTKEFLDLKRFLKKQHELGVKIFPPAEDVYSWSRHTPLHEVKAVILGQDPYHNHGQAHGLCFSVRPPTPAPPSLKNMYIALKNDYPSFEAPPNKGGLLTPWAERGVLMLNTCLTVQAHKANSHQNQGWERFTQKVIDTVVKVRTNGVVFLAWGLPASKRVSKVQKDKHCVLQAPHPSPLSAHKGFFTCGHFKKTNEWLEKRYGKDGIIDWNLLPSVEVKAATEVAEPKDQVESKTEPAPKDAPEAEEPKTAADGAPEDKKDTDSTD